MHLNHSEYYPAAGGEQALAIRNGQAGRRRNIAFLPLTERSSSAGDLAGELLRFARRENFTQIVLGRSRVGFFTGLLSRSLTQELVRRSRDIAVHIVTDQSAPPPERRGVAPPSSLSWRAGLARRRFPSRRRRRWPVARAGCACQICR